ncbi:DUF262 domain-containing protein [Pseudoclavibacter helvolus]|uniref:DUF262 domain-containing protein n=1 Tax=Pseudoclavibacter helvolus TaxID=255205 RepID=UPI0008385FDE|nr:DUF262 domain-containing protein [Pseudoclavibacter helvolus]
MGAGSEAQNRTVKDWLTSIDWGQLRLPSFQRGVAWDAKRVASMLNTIIHDLPLGVALVLNIGDKEQFVSRPLMSAPETNELPREHLLDGQQRLTALYRALRDNDPSISYFIHFPELDQDPRNDDEGMRVAWYRRWQIREAAYPMWVDSPAECLRRGLIPVRLLDPANDESAAWVDAATAHLEPGEEITDIAEYKTLSAELSASRDNLKKLIATKREIVSYFNLPFLRLPATTSKETALSVFVNMNTNAKPLSAYDIVVAELEAATGERLKEMEAKLDTEVPRLSRYLKLDNAVLQTQALLQGRTPNQRGYFDMDYTAFVDNWSRMTQGLRRAVETIESLHIHDGERLPTAIPIPVIAALLADEPETGDRRGQVDQIMRRYAWRAFFTSRYESAAPSRAAADHKGLAQLLSGNENATVPVFDDVLFPLPTDSELRSAKWPKGQGSLARAILAATNYFGARDFADDTKLSTENVTRREYHHVFPNKLLDEAGLESMKALNCVLITWKTNRTIGRLDPITYLKKRAENALDPIEVKERLDSHLVPYTTLAQAGPYGQTAGTELQAAVQPDYDAYLDQRAVYVRQFMITVCAGREPYMQDILDSTTLHEKTVSSTAS